MDKTTKELMLNGMHYRKFNLQESKLDEFILANHARYDLRFKYNYKFNGYLSLQPGFWEYYKWDQVPIHIYLYYPCRCSVILIKDKNKIIITFRED